MSNTKLTRCSVSGLLLITIASVVVDDVTAYAVEVSSWHGAVTARLVVRGQGVANWFARRLAAGDARALALVGGQQ